MPGIAFKLMSIVPALMAILFTLGAVGLLGDGPTHVNGGVILFVSLMVASARWLWREGDKRDGV